MYSEPNQRHVKFSAVYGLTFLDCYSLLFLEKGIPCIRDLLVQVDVMFYIALGH